MYGDQSAVPFTVIPDTSGGVRQTVLSHGLRQKTNLTERGIGGDETMKKRPAEPLRLASVAVARHWGDHRALFCSIGGAHDAI